jgi:hypothetical protein
MRCIAPLSQLRANDSKCGNGVRHEGIALPAGPSSPLFRHEAVRKE